MARRMLVLDECDECEYIGIPEVPASASVVLAINGGPARRILLCARCEHDFAPLAELYRERGVDVEEVVERRQLGEKWHAKKPEPKELEQAPAQTASPIERVESAHAKKKPKDKEKEHKEQVRIICPEPHQTESGGPKSIGYVYRTSHVDQCHKGMRIWDITWVYPKGLEVFPCTSHAECIKTGLSYTTPKGVSHHVKAAPLSRIDLDTPEEVP